MSSQQRVLELLEMLGGQAHAREIRELAKTVLGGGNGRKPMDGRANEPMPNNFGAKAGSNIYEKWNWCRSCSRPKHLHFYPKDASLP